MNISYRWLQSLVPGLKETPQELADRLAMYGAPVDALEAVGEGLRQIIIARVVEAKRHPNAERLSVCKVDAGTGTLLNVVCGAPNVRADRYYPFAPVGASLPDGMEIGRRKIRGEESQGMLCSARELALGRDHEGILELVGEFTPGESFIQAVGLDDYRIVVDVTPNRPDLLSHYGVARELAPGGESDIVLYSFAKDDSSERPTLTPKRVSNDGELGGIRIRIDDAEACPRYMASRVRGVRVGPSPEWLAMRLRAIGQRPINNVVDATNYVLHELGQPLHAFDAQKLGGSAIVVRRARAGEKLTTLDGVERTLQSSMLVIADADKATAIAGVMGGQFSEVEQDTTDVLIECAHFERKQVRETRRALGLSTDASYRFERGVDPTGMERALRRVTELIAAIAGGTADQQIADVYPIEFEQRKLQLRWTRVRQVLGLQLTGDELERLLAPIGFRPLQRDREITELEVPGHRWFDVLEEIDLVEEVARRYGYEQFPAELGAFRPSTVPDSELSQLEDRMRDRLVGRGLLEARTAGFAPEAEGDVTLMLPLSSAESRLRRAVLPALLHRVEYNFTRGTRDVRLFEIGTAFERTADGERPNETTRLAIALTGARAPQHWTGSAGEFEIWDLKGMLEELALALGYELRTELTSTIAGVSPLLERGSAFELWQEGRAVGQGGLIAAKAIDAPAWAAPVFGLELVLDTKSAHAHGRHQPLPVYPAIEQDLALLVPENISAATVTEAIRGGGGALLEEMGLFDLYRGKGIPEGTRSLAYRLRFRAPDRTLTDAEAVTAVQRVLKRLKDEYGIERRG
jgi:phenylalanyl-tRNA synthetase beta chain